MRYEIKARGEIMDTVDDKATAIVAAQAYPAEWRPSVVAHEISGTYESWTQIWPTHGETYTN